MIKKFKTFEKLIIGNRGDDYVKGVFIRDYNIFKNSIYGIIRFLKKKKVEYCIYFGNDSKDYYFIHRLTPNNETIIVEYGFVDSKGDDSYLIKNEWKTFLG